MALAALLVVSAWAGLACGGGDDGSGRTALDVELPIGESATLGGVVIEMQSIVSAFQPASPPQKLSDDVLVAPASGESFYQARLLIENKGTVPVRVDPEDFLCRIGNVVTTVEPARTGPKARSLISGSSLQVIVTFRGRAGMEPVVIYDPPWYDGTIYFSEGFTSSIATTTTLGVDIESSTTESSVQ